MKALSTPQHLPHHLPHNLLAILALAGAACTSAQAAFITNSSGLVGPQQTVDFESVALVQNAPVTTEFLSLGVSFGNAFGNPDTTPGYANISGNRIGNFQGGVGNQGTLVLDFSAQQSSVAFAMVTAAGGLSTFQAFLNGVLVEEATASTTFDSLNNFYGFEGIRFDRIALSVASFDRALMIDNLQTIGATVPVPGSSASWALFMLGIVGANRIARRSADRGPATKA